MKPRPEHPPLGISYIYGFSEGATAFPVLAVAMDPRGTGYQIPALNSQAGLSAEHVAAYPSCKFTGVESISEERIVWLYEILPGPPVITSKYDSVTDGVITIAKTKKLLASIAEGIELLGFGTDAYVRITESEPVGGTPTGYEVATTFPRPEAHSEDTAHISEAIAPFQFDQQLDILPWLITNGIIGLVPAFVRRIPHVTKTWWVFQEEKPPLNLNGLRSTGTIYKLYGQDVGEILYNPADVYYSAISATFEYPGSTPSRTEYISDWVGGAPRSVDGTVERDGNKYRWKIQKVFIQFILPLLPEVPDLGI